MSDFHIRPRIAAIILASMVSVCGARADNFMLDYGNVAASDKQITITRLPIFKKNGSVIYRDVTIKFKLDNKNRIIVQKKYPKTKNSGKIQSADIVAGKYYLDGETYTYELVGPGVGPKGREVWSLIGISSGDNADLTFYSGPVDGHPLQTRLNDAGIASSPYTFGESKEAGKLLAYFSLNCLVSAHMISGVLKLNSHSSNNCNVDHENPTETYTLRLCTPSDDCD